MQITKAAMQMKEDPEQKKLGEQILMEKISCRLVCYFQRVA